MIRLSRSVLALIILTTLSNRLDAAPPQVFFEAHCHSCHNPDLRQGGLDLTALKFKPDDPANLTQWVKIHDRIAAGEMPPSKRPRPQAAELSQAIKTLTNDLRDAERQAAFANGSTRLRRLTRAEYENTIRDLFEMPGIALQIELPPDGNAHGFDKNSDALDLSPILLGKYLEAADRVLDMAIATRPHPPRPINQIVSLANPHGFVAHVLLHGDGVLLKNKKPDPDFPPAAEQMHFDQGAHVRMGLFHNGASVGLFRHEDDSFHPYFNEFVALYPGHYRLKTSIWSFQWDKGEVLPARGIETVRLSVVQLVGDGRGGGHPSKVLGYFDAPSLSETTHEVLTWLNPRETIGFNAASLVTGQTRGPKRAMGFTGPGIACDYLSVEGPIHKVWPPQSHRQLFGDLPIREFVPSQQVGIRPPPRRPELRQLFMGRNQPDPVQGIWTVWSERPTEDAARLLAAFLPRAFRRSVAADIVRSYVQLVSEQLKRGESFEQAMRMAYRAALCSPDFLYHIEPVGKLDDYALANRLSYFLWNSMPDDALTKLASQGTLKKPSTLDAELHRLLADPRSNRFIEDFLDQWLLLKQIAATDPDKKLYPEFTPYLQDSMVAETRAYFRELLSKNLSIEHLVKSDFVMINGRLATLYGLPNITGSRIRPVGLPKDSPRGGVLTQAAILKLTANGTTTSPVPRGAFVLDRILGERPAPPPPNIPAVEPDVRGSTTIREQLAKHRDHPSCANCHAKIDPPGFALEEFDVIGGHRTRYRTLEQGAPAPRGNIDPFHKIEFKLGPKVDASGTLLNGRTFSGVQEYKNLLAADPDRLLTNLAKQMAIYSTGRPLSFSDRQLINDIINKTMNSGGGIRTLLRELVLSPLFQAR